MFITIKSTETNLNKEPRSLEKSAVKSKQVAEIFELNKHTFIISPYPNVIRGEREKREREAFVDFKLSVAERRRF